MTLSAIDNHVEHGLSRLIEQFKGRPRLEAWISSYLEEVQELSDAAWEVLVTRLIDNAAGAQLTTLGRLVGQQRTIENDDRFRVLVRARIAVNTSRGLWGDIIRVARILLGDDVEFSLREFLPGALVLTVEDPIAFIPTLEHEMLEQAASSGIRIDLHFHATPSDGLFRWGEGPGWGVGVWGGAVSEHGTT